MIAERLLTPSGELRPEFTASRQQSSRSAETYFSPEVIIQKRAASLYPAWKLRIKILSAIDDPQGLLIAAKCQIELDEQRGCFWVQYQRHDLPESPGQVDYQQLSPKQLEELFALTLPEIIATEQLLRQSEVDPALLSELYWQESSKVHLVRNCGPERIRQLLATIYGMQITAAAPEVSERLVLSHGDTLLKNLIATASGYRLVDWEALGLYPQEFSLVHALGWILLKMPPEHWPAVIERQATACQPLTGLNQQQLQLALYWQCLQHALFWSNDRQCFADCIAASRQLRAG